MGITQQIGASSLIKPGVIDNTAARPASPYEGQVIYQKDTDEILAYNGTSWTRPANMPWGVVGYTKTTSGNTTITTSATDISGSSITFTAVTGRAYKVTFTAPLSASSGQVLLLDVVLNSSTALYDYLYTGFAGYRIAALSTIVTGLTAGSNTIKMRGSTDTGTATMLGTSGNPASFIIEDIGPA